MSEAAEIIPATDTQLPAVIHCLNCGAQLMLEYCPACGQKRIKDRLRFRQLAVDFIHNYFELDQGLWFTIREMTLRPGHAVNAFLAGRRKPFIKPVQFYLIMLTVYFLITEGLGIDFVKLGRDFNEGFTESYTNGTVIPDTAAETQSSKVLKDFNAFFGQNIKVIFSILVFITAWVMKMLYRRSPYTFTELVVFTLYTHGITLLLSVGFTGLFYFDMPHSLRNSILAGFTVLYSVYYSWSIYQFYPNRGTGGMLKAIVAYLLAIVIYTLLSSLAGAILVIWSMKNH